MSVAAAYLSHGVFQSHHIKHQLLVFTGARRHPEVWPKQVASGIERRITPEPCEHRTRSSLLALAYWIQAHKLCACSGFFPKLTHLLLHSRRLVIYVNTAVQLLHIHKTSHP